MQRKSETSSVGRSRQLPRRGSQERGLRIKRLFDKKMPECCSVAPHHLASLCPPSPQGEGTKWLTIFAEKMKFTEFFSGKGKACKDLYRLLTQTLSPKGKARIRQRMLATFPEGESRECGLRIKRLFEKMPDCCSAAPHHLALQGASPRGEAAKRLTIFASLCASTMRQGEGLT